MTKQEAPKHILIPEHKKVSEKEKKDVLARYNISVTELPSIKKNDPGLRGLEVEEGDVIKVVRESPTAGKIVFYRGVING